MQQRCLEPAALTRRVFRQAGHQQSFERKGYVVVDILDATAVAELLYYWEQAPDKLGTLPYSSTVFSRDLQYRHEMFHRIADVFRPRVEVLLHEYRICTGGFIRKKPQDQRGTVELHQDPTAVDESRYCAIGVWCPLVDVGLHNGCLRVVSGSHRINRGPRDAMDIAFPYPELLPILERDYLTDVPMTAGQAFVYTQALFHASPPNMSERERTVAGVLAVPQESTVMVYLRDQEDHRGQYRCYAVDDDTYRDYKLGDCPDESFSAGRVDDKTEPMTQHELCAILGASNAG